MEVHDGEEDDRPHPTAQGELVCLTVYKKGAMEVVRRLAA